MPHISLLQSEKLECKKAELLYNPSYIYGCFHCISLHFIKLHPYFIKSVVIR